MVKLRTIAGTGLLLAAAAGTALPALFAYGIATEYGMKPNGSVAVDFTIGFLYMLPLLVLNAVLIWSGVLLAVPRWTRYTGWLALAAVVAAALAAAGASAWGDHVCRTTGISTCGDILPEVEHM